MPLERALNGTPGMILMRSESLFGLSLITLTFDDDVDAFNARDGGRAAHRRRPTCPTA